MMTTMMIRFVTLIGTLRGAHLLRPAKEMRKQKPQKRIDLTGTRRAMTMTGEEAFNLAMMTMGDEHDDHDSDVTPMRSASANAVTTMTSAKKYDDGDGDDVAPVQVQFKAKRVAVPAAVTPKQRHLDDDADAAAVAAQSGGSGGPMRRNRAPTTFAPRLLSPLTSSRRSSATPASSSSSSGEC